MKALLSLFFIAIVIPLAAQNDSLAVKRDWYELGGYVNNTQTVIIDSVRGDWTEESMLHNRLNFTAFPNDHFRASLQLRNRFVYGETFGYYTRFGQDYADQIEADRGLADLSWNLLDERSFLLNSTIDRAFLSYENGDLKITAGRQRINWGQTLVWNPNDLFNNYSFFEVDYPERPGSDAVRVEYFTGFASGAELAVKADSGGNVTAAGLYRFNYQNYDVQFLAGYLNSQDLAVGAGWSGYVGNTSFRGELSYFHPEEQMADTSGLFIASIGADYTFSNSLMVQGEFLYSQQPPGGSQGLYDLYSEQLSVKNLSFAEYNIFGQLSYPFTPLLNGSLSGMYFPELKGFYIGPSIDYSLSQNTRLSFILQHFGMEVEYDYLDQIQTRYIHMSMAYLQLRWSF